MPRLYAGQEIDYLVVVVIIVVAVYRELNTEADNTDGARNNEYNINAGPSVSLRANSAATTLAPSHVRVRGSFIRQLTDDFIIPLMNLTLLVKIGEGGKGGERGREVKEG